MHVEKLQFLAKALLPMPDKMHGINDPEIRQRQRYADLIAGSLKLEERDASDLTPREVFELRSKVVREIRRFLDEHGYVEVETPMLTPLATGAAAKPFKTHHNALDIDLFARIAPELYLKRLVVGGFEKVYELNRNFRNEGISTKHNPEFTMLEFYVAYADVNQMMDFAEKLLRTVVYTALGHTHVRYGEHDIDFSQPFQRMAMKEAIARHWQYTIFHKVGLGDEVFAEEWLDDPVRVQSLAQFLHDWQEIGRVNLYEPWRGTALSEPDRLSRVNVEVDRLWKGAKETATTSISKMGDDVMAAVGAHIASIFEAIAEKHLIQPTFVYDFPKPISPLSKASPSNPSIAERFEFFVGALETGNGFSELNDPEEQYRRFMEQVQKRERGDDEAMLMDEDYIRALSYGMPPAAGIGLGIDRLMMLFANKHSIRDVILFPHMRPQTRHPDPILYSASVKEVELKAHRPEIGIFLSHSSQDAEIAKRIAEALSSMTDEVVYADWAIAPDQSIVEKINQALAKNDILLVLLSRSSVKSKWVKHELNTALVSQLTGQTVTVLPILIEDCDIPDTLQGINYIDMRRDFREGLARLVESLQLRTSS